MFDRYRKFVYVVGYTTKPRGGFIQNLLYIISEVVGISVSSRVLLRWVYGFNI